MDKFLIGLILSLGACALPPAAGAAGAGAAAVSVRVAPPLLPVYARPAPPADDFLWMPGYWAWGDEIQDHFWVPGTWVLAPKRGDLWTPGYWYWSRDHYHWSPGYWSRAVGFYGGLDYGYGYHGSGNAARSKATTANRVSYNGGPGGIAAEPGGPGGAAGRPLRTLTAEQLRHEQGARARRALRAAANKGRPPIAATPRPGAFTDPEARPASRVPPPRSGPPGTLEASR